MGCSERAYKSFADHQQPWWRKLMPLWVPSRCTKTYQLYFVLLVMTMLYWTINKRCTYLQNKMDFDDAKVVTQHFHKKHQSRYSAFRCIGGSQGFPNMTFQGTQMNHGWPKANLDRNRLCLFENVCWIDNNLVFYEDPKMKASTPSFLWPETFGDTMLHLGYVQGHPWTPATKQSALPPHLPLQSDVPYLLNIHSYSDNFAHLLIDDLIPALAALSLFNLPVDEAVLLSRNACRTRQHWYEPSLINPSANRSRESACLHNYNIYTPLLLGKPMIDPIVEWSNKSVCMHQLIAGQSSVFSLRSLDLQRGQSFRIARDLLQERLGLQHILPPTSQSVVILTRRPGFDNVLWPTLCRDTKKLLVVLQPGIDVHCFSPDELTLEEEVKLSLGSSLIVAEHGTVSYSALYGHDGLVLLSVGRRAEIKDAQINLYATHYETYYFPVEERDALFEGMLHFTLSKAASNFGFNQDCQGLCALASN